MSLHLTQAKQAGLLLALGAALVTASGCGDACEELQSICDTCQDVNQKYSCEESVDRGDQEICEKNIDDFGTICK